MLAAIFLLIIFLFLTSVCIILLKIKKKIGQKIDVIYNQIYILMIEKYTGSGYGLNLLKEEMEDFANRIILVSGKIDNKINYFGEIKYFILELLKGKIENYLNELDLYQSYYRSIDRVLIIVCLAIMSIVLSMSILLVEYFK